MRLSFRSGVAHFRDRPGSSAPLSHRQISSLNLGDYLTDVCRDMDDAAAHCDVSIAVDEGVIVATDRAIPISLLVTELITNAAKHAYGEGEACRSWLR